MCYKSSQHLPWFLVVVFLFAVAGCKNQVQTGTIVKCKVCNKEISNTVKTVAAWSRTLLSRARQSPPVWGFRRCQSLPSSPCNTDTADRSSVVMDLGK